jgi:hypothetical protein
MTWKLPHISTKQNKVISSADNIHQLRPPGIAVFLRLRIQHQASAVKWYIQRITAPVFHQQRDGKKGSIQYMNTPKDRFHMVGLSHPFACALIIHQTSTQPEPRDKTRGHLQLHMQLAIMALTRTRARTS